MTAPEPSRLNPAPLERSARSFELTAERFRRELRLHCYRMLGSLHESEDAVQETYLRAWRGFERYDERGSLRAWLYRIATNVCLNALESRTRGPRLLPNAHVPAEPEVRLPSGPPSGEVLWLEPFPDAHLDGIADDAPTPEARFEFRESVQLAFISAIQQLPPRQRAVVLLCDVLGWSAAESAGLLGATTASVNSALQRARETLAKRFPDGPPAAAPRPTAAQQALLDRYLHAWEGHDVDGFVALVKEDAIFTMPPWSMWYEGREQIRGFFALAWQTCGGLRLVPTLANAQPAFAVYEEQHGVWRAHSIHVLTFADTAISELTTFIDERLFAAFGLPLTLDPGNPLRET